MTTHYYTTQKKADIYDAIYPIFEALFREIKDLGKKKPEATLSESKIKLINRVLIDLKDLLSDTPNAKYLELLDDEVAPQFGDAILMLAQFEGALNTFYSRHHGWNGSTDDWFIEKKK
ncbi:hypothetical protein HW571_29415 [Agrobacterium genomosp. 3]|uniref:hypothetical protein n=1 Tax=Agrobacterium tomkonis TaxID=1183410 RepID=UPI001CD8EC10|nr:hypothetical protein [Agrobacterium tomkonis]MCA1880041.1 hypothetical protein [Agrobacterium tumefaciens]MCA1895296.1 hypothetical protein [Agrobacterium tomkonis]